MTNTTIKGAQVAKVRNVTQMCVACHKLYTPKVSVCTCGGDLTTPHYFTKDTNEKRYYAFDEVHFDIGSSMEQSKVNAEIAANNGTIVDYLTRFYYRFDKERGSFFPDKRVKYLPVGRNVILTWHEDPKLGKPYLSGDGAMHIDALIKFTDGDKNAIQFLPEKTRTTPKADVPLTVHSNEVSAASTSPIMDSKEAAMRILGLDPAKLAAIQTLFGQVSTPATPKVVMVTAETPVEQVNNMMASASAMEDDCPDCVEVIDDTTLFT